MNLRQIIRESINSVILDSIISETIENDVILNEDDNRPADNENWYQSPQAQNAYGSYGYQNSGFDDAGHDAPVDNKNGQQQPQQQNQQQETQKQAQQQAQQKQVQQQNQQAAAYFKQFADELRRIVGNTGIDAKPVQNNQAAVQHINILNHFVFDIINAIDNGNINAAGSPAAGNDYNSKWSNLYGKDKVDAARDATGRIVNFAGGKAEEYLGSGAGFENNPLNNVFSTGVKAYNETDNGVTQLMNTQKYADAYGDKPQIASSGSLAELMKMYPNIFSQYQQINKQTNNIFSATPGVGNCYNVLQNLHAAVANYQKNQQQTDQNGASQGQTNQNGANQTQSNSNLNQTTSPEVQPEGGYGYQNSGFEDAGHDAPVDDTNDQQLQTSQKQVNNPVQTSQKQVNNPVQNTKKPKTIDFTENKAIDQYKNYFMQFDKTDWTRPVYKKIAKKYKGETLNEMNDFVFDLEGTLGECLDALETNSVRASDENRTRRKSLTRILGLTYDTRSDTSFYNIRAKYNTINQATGNYLANLEPVGEIMDALIGLYNVMRNNNIVDKNKSNGDFTKPFK